MHVFRFKADGVRKPVFTSVGLVCVREEPLDFERAPKPAIVTTTLH